VESDLRFWGTPRILQNSLPPSNRTRFQRFLDRPSALSEVSTTGENFSKHSFRNTQVEGILNRLGFHTGLDELRAERVANARIAADLAAAAEAEAEARAQVRAVRLEREAPARRPGAAGGGAGRVVYVVEDGVVKLYNRAPAGLVHPPVRTLA